MARRRFFVPEVRRGYAELTGPDAEHLVRVLRCEAGQVYEISDNREVYLARIELARKTQVSFKVLEKLDEPAVELEVILVAALIKFDHFEWLVEKATELGVAAIQPFEATRSERGLAQAASKRLSRWEKIALEASQQSRRARLPEVRPVVRFAKALAVDAGTKLRLDESAEAVPILSVLAAERKTGESVALLVGPEGGWTEDERGKAHEAGWVSAGLGGTILRAETAAIAALAITRAAWASFLSGRAQYDHGMNGLAANGQHGEK